MRFLSRILFLVIVIIEAGFSVTSIKPADVRTFYGNDLRSANITNLDLFMLPEFYDESILHRNYVELPDILWPNTLRDYSCAVVREDQAYTDQSIENREYQDFATTPYSVVPYQVLMRKEIAIPGIHTVRGYNKQSSHGDIGDLYRRYSN